MDAAKELGQKTTKKFLTALIPDDFREIVFRGRRHWACCVEGKAMSVEKWKRMESDIKDAFGSNLLEISKGTSNRFIVYLRKDQ